MVFFREGGGSRATGRFRLQDVPSKMLGLGGFGFVGRFGMVFSRFEVLKACGSLAYGLAALWLRGLSFEDVIATSGLIEELALDGIRVELGPDPLAGTRFLVA